jgi:hypothetical protein
MLDLPGIIRQALLGAVTLTIFLATITNSQHTFAQQESGTDQLLKVTAKTNDNRAVYGYGEIIPLNVTFFNAGDQIINLSSSDLKPYAGLGYSCAGVMYYDFIVLDGDYSKEVRNYDDLLRLKDKAIYVVDPPFRPHSCLLPYIQSINSVVIYPGVLEIPDNPLFSDGDSKFTINYVTKSGSTDSRLGSVLPNLYLRDVYEGSINNETGTASSQSKLLPPGKYTVVAFTLSSQMSKPLVLDVRVGPDISFLIIMGVASLASVVVLLVLPRYQRRMDG